MQPEDFEKIKVILQGELKKQSKDWDRKFEKQNEDWDKRFDKQNNDMNQKFDYQTASMDRKLDTLRISMNDKLNNLGNNIDDKLVTLNNSLREEFYKMRIEMNDLKNGQSRMSKQINTQLGMYHASSEKYIESRTDALNERMYKLETEIEHLKEK